jgi:IS605 OrfB family transposase
MSVKAIQAKVVCRHLRLRDYLWATHRLFNEALAFAIKEMLAMKHGAKGPLAKRFDPETAEKFQAVWADMMLDEDHDPFRLHPVAVENKKKREGRSQSAHAWMELITSKDSKRDSKSKTIHPKVTAIIGELLERATILFDRDQTWNFGGDNNGFRRLLFDMAARRIITNVQNEENHQKLLADCQAKFDEWKAREKTHFAEFEKVLPGFQAYEQDATRRAQSNVKHRVREEVKIDGAMTKGWRDLQQRLEGAEADAAEATKRIKDWQKEDPKAVGDINFFMWLADKPRLWPWVRTMQTYNGFHRQLEQLSRPVNFSYPRCDARPEWFSFSESSPGHMYDFDVCGVEFGHLLAYLRGEAPLQVRLHVFVPKADADRWKEIEKKRKKGQPVTEADLVFLNEPIRWQDFEAADDRIPEPVRGLFRNARPLDLSKFARCWVEYELKPDVRWRERVRYAGKGTRAKRRKEGGGKETQVFEFDWGFNLHEPIWRRLHKFGGAKLIYQPRPEPGVNPARLQPYLYFSFEIEPAALQDKAFNVQFKSDDAAPADSATTKTKPRKVKPPKLPPGLRVMAVDLGMRHLAITSVCEVQDGKLIAWQPRRDGKPGQELPNLKATLFLKLPGLELRDLQRHEWQKKDLQRETAPRGHLRRGEDFAIELTEHLDEMKDDRAKKAAHVIAEAAVKHGVHWLVFENLTGYRPEQELTRDVNSRLRNWNRRKVVEQVRQLAECYGIRVYDYAAPAYTSRVCAMCGHVGARFSQIVAAQERRDARFKTPKGLKTGLRQVLPGGQMFACAHCRRIVNADFNASLNLHRRFERSFDFADRYDLQRTGGGDLSYFYNDQRLVGKAFWESVAAEVQRFLNEKFHQGDVPPAGGWPKPKPAAKSGVPSDEEDDVPFD